MTKIQKTKKTKVKAPPPAVEFSDTNDILPPDMPLWEKLEKMAFGIADYYNFSQIETPVLEKLDLFARAKIGKDEDFRPPLAVKSKHKDELVLRSDMRIPTMRSYIGNGFAKLPQPQRLFYLGPIFKEGKDGRPVELHELGFEIIGGPTDPIYDVQVINLAYRLLEDLKIKEPIIKINSAGCLVCRPNHRKKLLAYYKPLEVCNKCEKRLQDNPIEVFLCRNDICQEFKAGAPPVIDSICSGCRNHFKGTLEFLEEVGKPYLLDNYLIPRADYYDKTIFEIVAASGDAEDGKTISLASGGRYDYLAEAMGGRSTPAVGVTIGFRSIFDFVKSRSLVSVKLKNKVFLVYIGDLAKRKALSLIEEFSRHNIPVVESLGRDSLAVQLEFAVAVGSPIGLIFGQKEAYEETVILRDMKTGMQEIIPLRKIIEVVKKRLKEY